MDKEQLNAKLREKIKQAGFHAQHTKEKLGKVLGKENVKEKYEKAKHGVGKAVDGTMNSNFVKNMSAGQKLTALVAGAFVIIVIIALMGRLLVTPAPSVWCAAEAPVTELAFVTAGTIAEIPHAEKQVAAKGDIIARLQDETYAAAFESAEAKSMEANLKLLKMENRLTDMENALADSKLKAAEGANAAAALALELAKEYEKQYVSFVESGAASEAHHEGSLKAVADAEAEAQRTAGELEAAKQYLETAQKGHTPEEIAAAKQESEAAAQEAANAKAVLEGAVITAPFDAYISKINAKVGDSAEPGKAVFEVVDLSKIQLRGLVNKGLTETLKAGAVVNVEFNDIKGETFTGKIVTVSQEPVEQKDGEDMYELRMELDNLNGSILPGMEAVAIVSE